MINRMRSRHLQQCLNVLVLTIVFAMSFAWLPTQAAALPQKSSCQISVKSGWSPHRVEAEDTLASLAARSGVTVDDLMQANCLESAGIEVGSLVLTPKLGPVIPTPTPTAIPTEAPTVVPTPTKPAIVIVEESSSATESKEVATESSDDAATTVEEPVVAPAAKAATSATSAASEETVVIDLSGNKAMTDSESAPAIVVIEPTATATPVADEKKEEEKNDDGAALINDGGSASSSFPLGTSGLIGISLFIMGSVSALFFALQPRRHRSAEQQPASFTGSMAQAPHGMGVNIAFLIGGFVIGAILFPMLRMPGFVALPTWLSAMAAIGLIGLLAVKEILLGAVQWRGLNRLLNLGIAPLLMIFILSVVSRFAGMAN